MGPLALTLFGPLPSNQKKKTYVEEADLSHMYKTPRPESVDNGVENDSFDVGSNMNDNVFNFRLTCAEATGQILSWYNQGKKIKLLC
jgi:hypothetical protein